MVTVDYPKTQLSTYQISTVADMATVRSIGNGQGVSLLGYSSVGDGGGQELIYRSTGRSAITLNGFYLAGHLADDYYEAVDKSVAFVDRFGADPTGVADSGAAINAALAASNVIRFGSGGTYLISTNVVYSNTAGVKELQGKDTTITPGTSGDLFDLTCDIKIRGLYYDGTGRTDVERFLKLSGGVLTNNCEVSGCKIENLNSATVAQAMTIGTFNSAKVDGVHFKNISAEKNDTVGDNNGAPRAIYSGGTLNTLSIDNVTIDGVNSVDGGINFPEDGDAIQVAGSVELFTSSNCYFNDVGKRAYKLSGCVNSVIEKVVCKSSWDTAGTDAMFAFIGHTSGKLTVRDCHAKEGLIVYFCEMSGDEYLFENCKHIPGAYVDPLGASSQTATLTPMGLYAVTNPTKIVIRDFECENVGFGIQANTSTDLEEFTIDSCKLTTHKNGIQTSNDVEKMTLNNSIITQDPASVETARQGVQIRGGVLDLSATSNKIAGYRDGFYFNTKSANADGDFQHALRDNNVDVTAGREIVDQSNATPLNRRNLTLSGNNWVEAPIALTGTVTVNPAESTNIDSSGGAVTATLGDGDYVGQIWMGNMSDATNLSTLTVTDHEVSASQVFILDAVDEAVTFIWTGAEWSTLRDTTI